VCGVKEKVPNAHLCQKKRKCAFSLTFLLFCAFSFTQEIYCESRSTCFFTFPFSVGLNPQLFPSCCWRKKMTDNSHESPSKVSTPMWRVTQRSNVRPTMTFIDFIRGTIRSSRVSLRHFLLRKKSLIFLVRNTLQQEDNFGIMRRD